MRSRTSRSRDVPRLGILTIGSAPAGFIGYHVPVDKMSVDMPQVGAMADPVRLLRAFLKKSGMSQAAFAAAAKVPQSVISRALSNRRTPGLTSAFRIEDATGGAVPAKAWVTESDSKANGVGHEEHAS